MRAVVVVFLLFIAVNAGPTTRDDMQDEIQKTAAKLSDSLFVLVKLQPQVKALEKQLEKNATIELQMDYIDLARRFVDISENTTVLSLNFLHLNGVNYTKRPLSAQEVYNIPQKMVVAELMVSMSGDNSQMIELANDLITHLNGVRCALIKRINEVVGKVNTENPAYPRSMLEFHEMTKYRPIIHIEETTKPSKPIKIRDECEQAKKKHLSPRRLKFFCGNFAN